MKKGITNPALLFLLALTILSSCNKSDMKDQLATTKQGQATDDGDYNVTRHHNSCCCYCPSSVATASSITYAISLSDYPEAAISTSVFYKNPGPQGTLKIVMSNVNGGIDSVSIVPAYHTNGGDSAVVQLQYNVDYSHLPCKLHVHGRPVNLDCNTRSQVIFDIFNEVSRNNNQ